MPARLQKLRFYASSTVIYGLTVLFAVAALRPLPSVVEAEPSAHRAVKQALPAISEPVLVSGRPVRIVLPASGVDLPVDPGYYDSGTDSWTLSGYRAQFATISAPANNQSGETFIYGHNNNYVFGALRHRTPQSGEPALIYTDSGRILAYVFSDAANVGPEDTSVLNFAGPPRLTVQTCTGSFSEWRTMYHFSFDKVVQ